MNRRNFLKHAGIAGALTLGSKKIVGRTLVRPTVDGLKSVLPNPLSMNALRIPSVISGGDLTIAQTTYKIFPDADTNILVRSRRPR